MLAPVRSVTARTIIIKTLAAVDIFGADSIHVRTYRAVLKIEVLSRLLFTVNTKKSP